MSERTGLRALLARLLSFAVGSGLGLLVDLGGFAALTLAGLLPVTANIVSSSLSVVVVYLFVTRRTFRVRAHPATFLCFAAWYAANIAATSWTIQYLVDHVAALPWVWKVALVPISFGANFLFNLALHRASAVLLHRSEPPPSPERTPTAVPAPIPREVAR